MCGGYGEMKEGGVGCESIEVGRGLKWTSVARETVSTLSVEDQQDNIGACGH